MTRAYSISILSLLIAVLSASRATAGEFTGIEHYMRVSGAVNAAQGSCEVRANVARLIALGKPYQLTARDPALEEKMIDVMVRSLNETGARIQDEGRDVVCAELMALYGPGGSDVPDLLGLRTAD
jgi:hypothetical protein